MNSRRRRSRRNGSSRINLWPRGLRHKPLALILFAILVVVLTALQYRGASGPDHERYHNRVFRCARIVDGDTIDISAPDGRYPTTRIRLWGVDTPETASSPQGALYFGQEASAFTHSCVENGDVKVVLAPDQTRDKFGRLLAYVYFGDPPRMLNEEIIRRGYGYADTRFDHAWLQRFRDLESQARRDGTGLWDKVRLDQMPTWRRQTEQQVSGSSLPSGI